MIQENPEIEPPDPDPRGLTYRLNGRGSPKFLFRFAEASHGQNKYLQKVGANPKEKGKRIIFRYDSRREEYTCIDCNSPAEELPSSRNIHGDPSEIQWSRGPYCRSCEIYPRNGRLESVNRLGLESSINAYEEAEKSGIQQII